MKKVLRLFLVILIGVPAAGFAQGKAGRNMEKIIETLNLDEKQAADFKKINDEFHQKMKAEWEAGKADREARMAQREKQREHMLAMRDERNEEIKKILTGEQYQQFMDTQRLPNDRLHKKGRKNRSRK